MSMTSSSKLMLCTRCMGSDEHNFTGINPPVLPVQETLHQKDQELCALRDSCASEAGPAAAAMREVGPQNGRPVKDSCALGVLIIMMYLVLRTCLCWHRLTYTEAVISSCCYG